FDARPAADALFQRLEIDCALLQRRSVHVDGAGNRLSAETIATATNHAGQIAGDDQVRNGFRGDLHRCIPQTRPKSSCGRKRGLAARLKLMLRGRERQLVSLFRRGISDSWDYFSTTQMFRKATGLPWFCRNRPSFSGPSGL